MITINNMVGHYLYEGGELPNQKNMIEYWVARNGVFVRAECKHTKCLINTSSNHFQKIKGLAHMNGYIHSLNSIKLTSLELIPIILEAQRNYRVVGRPGSMIFQASKVFDEQLFLFVDEPDLQSRIFYPTQTGTPSSVVVEQDAWNYWQQKNIIADIHTHPGAAYFSEKDNIDDMAATRIMYKMVIGDLGKHKPTAVLRLSVYGVLSGHIPLSKIMTEEATMLFGEYK